MNPAARSAILPLPPCRHRGRAVAPERWLCHSSHLVIPGQVVESGFCRDECPLVDHAAVDPPPRSFPARAEPHPDMSVPAFLEGIKVTSRHLPRNWQFWTVAQTAHRRLLDEARWAPVPPRPVGKRGRGIVIGAGGMTYFRCAWVGVTMLRRLGCQLPVEFWHLGPEELDIEMATLAARLGVTCRDARSIAPAPRRLGGWELKPFSLIHSSFAEVLYLDADNLPLSDPTSLFDLEEYRRHGAMFWPDLPPGYSHHATVAALTWDVAGISCREGRAFETGQFLVDTRRCWEELQLCMHLNERSDFWYYYVYGDKDTFKLAWHKRETRYAMPEAEAVWRHPAIWQHDPAGQPVFVHACQGKPQLIDGLPIEGYPHAAMAVQAARQLQSEWSRLCPNRSTWNPLATGIRHLAKTRRCLHRGKQLPSSTTGEVFACPIHGSCTIEPAPVSGSLVQSCVGCPDLQLSTGCFPRQIFPLQGLHSGHHFNASLIEHQGQTLLAYRVGHHSASIWIAGLSDDFQVLWRRKLNLPRIQENRLGCEDPRLFLYRHQLHLSYTGVESLTGTGRVNLLYARLSDDCILADHYVLQYAERRDWEKNWLFFEHGPDLYCVYTIAPQVILQVTGNQAERRFETHWDVLWKRGLLRGGASPVRIGDEFYSFFHGVEERNQSRLYTLGCYTFAVEPPFRPLRVVQEPLLWPRPGDRPAPELPHCVYPCGAIRRGDTWFISYGYYDSQVWVAEFPAKSVEEALVSLP